MRRAVIAFTAFLGGLFLFLGVGASSAWAQGEALRGQLRSQEQPVQGVKIDVTSAAGESVGNATTDAEGKWEVKLNSPGSFKVTIDVKTLPQGVTLAPGVPASRVVPVAEGEAKNVLFRLAPTAGGQPGQNGTKQPQPESASASYLRRVAQLVFEGLNLGLIIALAALGLSLIFGTTGLTNFAHGELVTFGAVIAYFFNVALGVPLIPAAGFAVIVGGIFGYFQDRFFWGKLRQRGSGLISMMIISIGMALFLRYLYQYFLGADINPYAEYAGQRGTQIGPVTIAPKEMIAMTLELIVLVVVGIALLKTRTGKATRAVSDNPALAASSGINVDRVIRLVWTVGGAIAALGGILLGLTQHVNFQMGLNILLLMFAGVTLGGLGTAFGALVGSVLIGLFVQLSTLVVPTELKSVGALGVLIVVLLVRPQGILGRRERVG